MTDKKVARRESRRIAIQTVFYYLEREQSVSMRKCFSFVLKEIQEKTKDSFALEIVEAAEENIGKVKVIIRAYAPEFPYEKIAPINRVLLVLGITEMKFLDTPPVVAINEYVDLAKDFGEDKSASFVNGVMDNYRRKSGLQGSKKGEIKDQ